MVFDFKKEYKEFYYPKDIPTIVNVPKAKYLAVKGIGNPNDIDGEYKNSISILYSVAYTLKMSYKTPYKIEGFYDYVVPPLEGFWWQEGVEGIDYSSKETFCWISLIRVPEFINDKDIKWAKEIVSKKENIDCSKLYLLEYDEGLCVEIMHIGSFDDEPRSVKLMHEYIESHGYKLDINNTRYHHEIYLSDARKVEKDKLKTVIRHPIIKK